MKIGFSGTADQCVFLFVVDTIHSRMKRRKYQMIVVVVSTAMILVTDTSVVRALFSLSFFLTNVGSATTVRFCRALLELP